MTLCFYYFNRHRFSNHIFLLKSTNQTFRMEQANPYQSLYKTLSVEGKDYHYYDLQGLNDPRLQKLPFSIRVLLESAIRNCDEFSVKSKYLFKTNFSKLLQRLISRPFWTGKATRARASKSHSSQLGSFCKISQVCQQSSTSLP